jgi:hypothetical protein
LIIPATQTLDRIAQRTGGSWSGTGTIRLGIYNHDYATGKPTTVLLDAGTVVATAASSVYTITINQALSPGIYWLAMNVTSTATANFFQNVTPASGNTSTTFATDANFTTIYYGWTQSVNASSGFATATSLSPAQYPITAAVRGA